MRKAKIEMTVNPLLEAIQEIQEAQPDNLSDEPEIVDIITFCEHVDYLNLPGNNFFMFHSQKIILKTFYMGSRGNEDLKLSKEDWEWFLDNEEDETLDEICYHRNLKEVIEKLLRKEKEEVFVPFKELHLCLGRRGTKTVLASIISAYEVYKLLKIGGGDPHKFYNLPADDEIAIINVALSQPQAGKLFNEISSRLRNSNFFMNRVAKGTTSEIRLYTDADLKKAKILKAQGSKLEVPGSILIMCGHSNPDTLAGRSAILILFDELAFYDESGKVTGSYFYNRLKPSLANFLPYGDGRLVEISSPNSMVGVFYDIFKAAKDDDQVLSYQLPTWLANPKITYAILKPDRDRNPENFTVEHGAQWAKSGVFGNYFEPDLIDRCIRIDLEPHTRPQPGFSYYLHIDPAKSNNRYVALLVAQKYYANRQGKRRPKVYLANMWIWDPKPGMGLMYNEINKAVIRICATFHPMIVSYDQYNSYQSLQLLRSHGINAIETSYNRSFKNKIYQNLKDLMAYQPDPEILLYDDSRLILEMKALKFRRTMRGISLVVDKHGEVKTDDIVDCLAGAACTASEGVRAALPAPTVVRTGWL